MFLSLESQPFLAPPKRASGWCFSEKLFIQTLYKVRFPFMCNAFLRAPANGRHYVEFLLTV